MGDLNQYDFINRHRDLFSGPFLEIGARRYVDLPDLRTLFPGEEWLGTDLSPGDGVDIVVDLTLPFGEVDAALGHRRFKTVFCLSVLEHCAQPFAMARNVTRLLDRTGLIHLSVPFAWKYHGFPSDYWRFTPEGVAKLFPDIAFDERFDHGATSAPGETFSLDQDLGRLVLRGRGTGRARGRWPRAADLLFLRLARLLGRFGWLLRYRYVMPPTMINRVGRLRKSARDM